MKKKVLMKRILTALAMTAMIPAGETWAEYVTGSKDNKDYTIHIDWAGNRTWNTEELPYYQEWAWSDKIYYSDFNKVEISGENWWTQAAGLEISNLKHGDMQNTDLEITVSDESSENQDALQVTGNDNDFHVKNFTATVKGADSDAIDIVNTATKSKVEIHGNLTANVSNGNGIRANASVNDASSSQIIVDGETKITLTGESVNWEKQDGMLHDILTGSYNPAAVYAGNDSSNGTLVYRKVIGTGTYTLGQEAKGQGIVELKGKTTINIGSNNYGLYAGKNGQISVGGDLDLELTSAEAENAVGIAAKNSNLVYDDKGNFHLYEPGVGYDLPITDTTPDTSANHFGSSVILNGDENVINVGTNNKAIYAEGVDANGNSNTVESGDNGIGYFAITGNVAAENGGRIDLHATDTDKTNSLTGDLTADGKADDGTASSASLSGYDVGMKGKAAATAGGTVSLTADHDVSLMGALTASGKKSQAFMTSKGGTNYIQYKSVIDNAGGLGESAKIVSALYAEHGGKIGLTGSFNYIGAGIDYLGEDGEGSESSSRRAVWAYDKADISITGGVQIEADYSVQDDPTGKNSTNMAIVAGTATGLDKDTVNDTTNLDRATVTVKYDSESAIKGDIVSAYAGKVDITPGNLDAKINITGNLLAGNNGILNVDLGNGGTLTGRADDYGDASADKEITGYHHGDGTESGFYNPAFSSQILAGGAVNLTMGAGSTWNVTGQSWITSINTEKQKRPQMCLLQKILLML